MGLELRLAPCVPTMELELSKALIITLPIKVTCLILHFKFLSDLTKAMEHTFIFIFSCLKMVEGGSTALLKVNTLRNKNR